MLALCDLSGGYMHTTERLHLLSASQMHRGAQSRCSLTVLGTIDVNAKNTSLHSEHFLLLLPFPVESSWRRLSGMQP
jgi:hypothetical protein